MFTAIGLMFLGIAAGFLLRGKPLAALLTRCVTPAIVLLLFALGISVGGNRALMTALPELGGAAIVLTLAGVAGSLVCVLCIRRFFRQPPEPAGFALRRTAASSDDKASPAPNRKDARS
ncbi:MAG: LysO family transporter [Desulfovibrio sp.]|nr:LysO family transporter [Desulfovibrio sp.]